MITRYRWLILLIVGILLGIYFIYAGVVRPVIEMLNRPPPPMYMYSASAVREVCDTLGINPEDVFCREPSEQNPVSLEAMLKRNFPIGETRLDDILPLLADFPSRAKGTAFEGKDFEPNGCQTFLEDNYECYVIFPGDINVISIGFASRSRIITYYGVTKMGS